MQFLIGLAHAQWGMDFAFGAASKSVYRGAETWPDASLRLGPGFSYNQRLFIQGPHVYWTFFDRTENQQLVVGVHYFDDNKPMIALSSHEKDYRNSRKNSLEFYSKGEYKFGFKNLFNINYYLARDFIAHNGLYGELGSKAPVLPFTSLNARISIAEQSSQQYLYGPEARSGAGYLGLGLRVVFPFLPFPGIAFLSYEKSMILKGVNKQSDLVRGRSVLDVLSMSVIAKIF